MTKSILLERIDLMYYDKNKSAIVLFEKVNYKSGKYINKISIYEDVGIGINDILDNLTIEDYKIQKENVKVLQNIIINGENTIRVLKEIEEEIGK